MFRMHYNNKTRNPAIGNGSGVPVVVDFGPNAAEGKWLVIEFQIPTLYRCEDESTDVEI